MSAADVGSQPSAVPAPRGLAWLEALALAAFAIVHLRGREHAVDLHVWDELAYFWDGYDFVRGEGGLDVAWSPTYSVLYGLLSWLPLPLPLNDLVGVGLAVAVALSAWWCLRAIAPCWVATAVAAFVVTLPGVSQCSSLGAPASPGAYSLALSLAFAAVGLQARGRTLAATLVVLGAVLTRGEYGVWYLGFAAIAFAAPSLRGRPRVRWFVLVSALAAFGLTLASPSHRARAWLAFCQPYARQACLRELAAEWERLHGQVDPERLRLVPQELQRAFEAPAPWIERDFPGADSLASALFVAPDKFFAHVEHNLLQFPLAIEAAWTSSWLPPASTRWLALVALAAAGAGLVRRRVCGGGPPRGDERGLWLPLASTSFLAMTAALFVSPRPDFCMPTLVCGSTVLAYGASGLRNRAWPESARLASGLAVAAAMGAMLLPAPFAEKSPPLPYRAVLDVLRRGLPAEPVVLLSMWWEQPLRLLERPDLEPRSLWGAQVRPFAGLLDEWGVNAVLVTSELEFELARFPDARDVLAAAPWRLAGERDGVRLYLR